MSKAGEGVAMSPAQWDQGWWWPARRCPSPNQEARPDPADISLLVLHAISLPPGQYGGGEIEALFTNRLDWDAHPYFSGIRGLRVSSHFVIDRAGGLVQFVPVHQRAWHAGVSTWRGRGNCNDFSIGIELEGLEGGEFTPEQYQCLVELTRALERVCPRLKEVVGHEHVAPGRKQDPGAGFDWSAYAQALGNTALAVWPNVAYSPQE